MKKLLYIAIIACGFSSTSFAAFSQSGMGPNGNNYFTTGSNAGSTPADCPLLKHLDLNSKGSKAQQVAEAKADKWIINFGDGGAR